MEEKKALFDEGKKVLAILATDGQPTEDDGTVNIKAFTRLLLERPENMYMSIVACTDDDSAVSYLSRLDSAIQNLDVVDDFKTEQRTMTRWKRGSKFTFGDYVVKILLASIDASLDKADGKGQGFIYYFIQGFSSLFRMCRPGKSNKVAASGETSINTTTAQASTTGGKPASPKPEATTTGGKPASPKP